jgi:hypothetical protein
MRATKSSVVGVLLGLSLVAACRSSNSAKPDAPDTTDTGPAQIHIQDVQSDAMQPNTPVELHGVIVTAIDTFGTKTGDLWVEEPNGGPFSGVHVFGTPSAQLANLAVGDIVDITGAIKTEFALTGATGDMTGRTTTELQAPKGGTMTVTKTGTGTVPAPQVIDAATIDAMPMTTRDAEYEKWEGVLVQVTNVRSRSYPQGFGSKPYPDDAYKFGVTGTLVVESTQTKLAGVDGLTCFASLTGVEDYFFDWLLLPRSAADVVAGTSCTPVTPTTSTIPAIQAALPTGVVELDNVTVTGVSNSRTSCWISASPTAAATGGAYVFQSSSTLVLDPAIVPGVQVNVIGTVIEFNDDTAGGTLTEIQPLRITVANGTPTAPTPVTGQTVAALVDPATAAQYESVLVTLDNVAITAIGSSANGFVATGKQAGTSFGLGTDILHLAAIDIDCYASITGLWTNLEAPGSSVTTKPNAFGFIPLTPAGKGNGTCN